MSEFIDAVIKMRKYQMLYAWDGSYKDEMIKYQEKVDKWLEKKYSDPWLKQMGNEPGHGGPSWDEVDQNNSKYQIRFNDSASGQWVNCTPERYKSMKENCATNVQFRFFNGINWINE